MKFINLQRDFSDDTFHVECVEANSSAEAWDIVEEKITNSDTQDWLMSAEKFEELKELINGVKA
jgi:hypothetical protein